MYAEIIIGTIVNWSIFNSAYIHPMDVHVELYY